MGGAAARTAIQFAMLMGFWLALSGRLEIKYIAIGVLGVTLVLWRGHDLLRSRPEARTRPTYDLARGLRSFGGFIRYLLWLLVAIIKANLYVAYIVVHPKLPIDPVLVRFNTNLDSDVSQVLLAHSITLTPGTVTIDVQNRRFLVHALSPESAGDLLTGNMQDRVARVFGFAEHAELDAYVSRTTGDRRP